MEDFFLTFILLSQYIFLKNALVIRDEKLYNLIWNFIKKNYFIFLGSELTFVLFISPFVLICSSELW